MPGHYVCHREFTAQQREEDSDHGISENQNRDLEIKSNNTFTFKYHYYYEYENSSYQMVTQVSNDTTFKGTVTKEGSHIKLNITGGEQQAKDMVKKKTVFSTKQIEGSVDLLEDGQVLKVTAVSLKPEKLDKIQDIIRINQVFKVAKKGK